MNKADHFFIKTCNDILKSGISTLGEKVRPVYSDGVPAHTLFLTQRYEEYDISNGEFPIITLRPLPWKSGIKEMFWIYQDQSSNLLLLKEKYGVDWWNDWNIGNETIGQRYGATVKKYNLMNGLLEDLKNEPYSRRHIIDLFQYADFAETQGLYPCAFQTLWSVRGEYLDVTLVQRSSDYLVANHINKIQYVALLLMVSRHVGLKPGKFAHFTQNIHIYDRHIDQAKELLSRKPSKKNPKLILDTDKNNFYDFTIEDFKMVDYDPVKPNLRFELGI